MVDDLVVIPEELLAKATAEERAMYRQYVLEHEVAKDEWLTLLPTVAPTYASLPFAPHHHIFWNWVWEIEAGSRPDPFVCILPRGGAKSSSAELAVAMLGARMKRRYCLYVSETQDQANDHVSNIAVMLESEIGVAYPEVGDRLKSKFGHSKGWKADRVRTASGFTVDAVGLDAAARGIKLEDMRPDLIVFDDIDGELDSPHITAKKIKTITRKLIPAGSRDVALLAIQNIVHEDSIFAQLADGRADFMKGRTVVGPIPAIYGLEWMEKDGAFVITGGTPSWPEGQGLQTCQLMMNDMGLTAFLAECQHEPGQVAGGMFDHLNFAGFHVSEAELPTMKRAVVWLDPAVTSTDQSDCQGIICDGLGTDGKVYRLWAWEGRTSPLDAMKRALRKAVEWHADTVGVETDQGGDTWQSVYQQACEELRNEDRDPSRKWIEGSAPRYKERKASQGHGAKAQRAQRMLVDYERDKFRHMKGTHTVLENALTRFPKVKPFDLVDTAYWSWWELTQGTKKPAKVREASKVRVAGLGWR